MSTSCNHVYKHNEQWYRAVHLNLWIVNTDWSCTLDGVLCWQWRLCRILPMGNTESVEVQRRLACFRPEDRPVVEGVFHRLQAGAAGPSGAPGKALTLEMLQVWQSKMRSGWVNSFFRANLRWFPSCSQWLRGHSPLCSSRPRWVGLLQTPWWGGFTSACVISTLDRQRLKLPEGLGPLLRLELE